MKIDTILLSLFLVALSTACLPQEASAQSRKTSYQSTGQHRAATETEAYLCEAVDEQPSFPGGEIALLRYINSERRYPAEAYRRQVQGRVLCGFIIGADGAISRIDVIRGVDESLNREAVRVIQNMPKWHAGKIGTQKVPVYYILPIPFRL